MTAPDIVIDKKTSPTVKKVLGLVALLILVPPAISQGETQTTADQVRVADVTVTGNRIVSTDWIMSFIKIRAGNQYSREALKNLLREDDWRILETRMFKFILPQIKNLPDGRINIEFTVKEYPNLIEDIIYKNANHISKKDLAELTGLRKGVPLDPLSNRKACFAIQDYLMKVGRYFAKVVLEEGGVESDHRVVFNITEGPVVRVTQVRFVGNHDLATSLLKNQINSSSATLNLALLDGDVLLLEVFYKSKGYMDVRVTREFTFNNDFHSVDVVFHIDEGIKYRIENVTVQDLLRIPTREIFLIPPIPEK